ncbi:hypothetical protein K458DRAFT_460186 [Lentithecium fluviatile CBS 122367]|uniref:P-loop containing nucleoside triphosphate hydrolase protein n=1 Tax=Lentithecium fluviatile CBS 122367 TaxID=1168545 RepID=A0A6G1IQ42_9PLEO|nr:hypothetical protein K458DRAFT_460186 [Lentithecium fluviatile CBS 122367]
MEIFTPSSWNSSSAFRNDLPSESAQSEIEAILGHMPQPSFLREVATDGRIGTALVKYRSVQVNSRGRPLVVHTCPGTVTTYMYHGMGRRIDMSALLSRDIVLTTYATVAAESSRGASMLSRIEWYRVVLDEAHTIRNTSTKQFRAIHSVPTHIRWCLTGTPIQNTLEDLGALIKFIRTPLLEEHKMFKKYVTAPIFTHSSGRFANLRRLLEALCLRRTKSLLKLPDPVTDTLILDLSASETAAYDGFGESCRHAIDSAVSGHSIRKANHHVIQAILGMRLFCNDGPSAFLGKSNARGLPSNPEEALSYLQATENSTCVQCESEVLTVYQTDDQSSGVLTTCEHLICGVCLPAFEADLEDSLNGGHSQCPICGHHAARESFLISPKQGHDTASGKAYPTKLAALLEKVHQKSPGDKCVIFSFWKKSLDLVAEILDSKGIALLRIHGSLPARKRAKILEEFEQSSSAVVLLITFGTGGVGINKLMAANQIHILEPQWNPSIESQAIGRILRFGQEQSVKIIRYIMKDTVEEAVRSQQLRKLQLARGGFALSKDEHTSGRVQEIMAKIQVSPEAPSMEKGITENLVS